MSLLSVVIPVYKAEKCLNELYVRLKKTLESITSDYEILLIDDGSKDASWQIIEELSKKDKHIKGIRFVRNFGQHIAITAGLERCNGDFVVIMDCDLQDPPEDIVKLYNKAKEGYHVVLAKRKERKDKFLKIATSFIFYKILSYLSGMKYNSQVGCFRIVSRQVVNNYKLFRDKIRFFISMVEWMGFPTASIDVTHSARFEGKSNYTLKKSLNLALDIIISNSDKPLKMSITIGFIVSICAFIAAISIFIKSLFFGISIGGWSSTIISLFFIGGIIILNLGLLGIYIGKIFEQVKDRPLYIELQEIGFN